MRKSSTDPKVKRVFESHLDVELRITLAWGDVFVLELEYELDEEEYDEDGIWYCNVVEAVSGVSPQFHKLFRPGSGLDIREDSVALVSNNKTSELLYKRDA